MADKDDNTETKVPSGTFEELKLMVTDYAKQETVEPLKNLGLWAAFGIVGALLLAIGAFLTGLGTLRLFQKMDWTEGTWSFTPYMIVFALLMVIAGMCFWAMTKTPEWMDDDS